MCFKKIRVSLVFILFILSSINSKGQVTSLVTSIDTIGVCTCLDTAQQVYIPLRVTNYEKVGAFSLQINFKTSALQYLNLYTSHPSIPIGFLTTNCIPTSGNISSLFIAWFSLTPGTITDGDTLMAFKFAVLCDTTSLEFEVSNCSYASNMGSPINAIYKTGYTLPTSASINTQPISVAVTENTNTQFTCIGSFCYNSPNYQWQVRPNGSGQWFDLSNNVLYNGVNTNTLYIPFANWGLDGFEYRCKVWDSTSIIFSNGATLTILDSIIPSTGVIEGTVTYDNTAHTSLTNTQVTLKQNNTIISSVITDSIGYYSFMNLSQGNYTLEVLPNTVFGGVNSTDGLIILKHFTGLVLLTGLAIQSADTDNNEIINSIDALMAVERFVGMINSFPAGDWVSEKPVVVCDGITTVNQNIKVLCVGDVDGSYIL